MSIPPNATICPIGSVARLSVPKSKSPFASVCTETSELFKIPSLFSSIKTVAPAI